MPSRPQVLVLNGTSSAGKSSLASALQARWTEPLLDGGLDRHLATLPRRYLRQQWPQIYTYRYAADGTITQIHLGPAGRRLYHAMHRAAAVTADCGLCVVMDHVLLDRESAVDLAHSLRSVRAALIGVAVRGAGAQCEGGRAHRPHARPGRRAAARRPRPR